MRTLRSGKKCDGRARSLGRGRVRSDHGGRFERVDDDRNLALPMNLRIEPEVAAEHEQAGKGQFNRQQRPRGDRLEREDGAFGRHDNRRDLADPFAVPRAALAVPRKPEQRSSERLTRLKPVAFDVCRQRVGVLGVHPGDDGATRHAEREHDGKQQATRKGAVHELSRG